MRLILKYLLLATISLHIFNANAEVSNNNTNNNIFTPNQSSNSLANAEAFSLQITEDSESIFFNWILKPEYYLYKDKIKITSLNNIKLNKYILFPKHSIFFDKNLNKNFKVYANNLKLSVNKSYINEFDIKTIKIVYQGCSSDGFCYSPIEKTYHTNKNFNNINKTHQKANELGNNIDKELPQENSRIENSSLINNFYNSIDNILSNQSIIKICIAFFVFGVLLSLSPCVLPMIPIILSIVVGRIDLVSKTRSFVLAISYVTSMAFTYAIIGIVAGVLGYNLQIYMQHPSIIIATSIFIIILACYMFDIIRFNLPININKQVYKLEKKQGHGAIINAITLGAIAALVITPCVTPALVAAITFLANDGSALTGGIALFSMGVGIGAPLILFAIGGSLLIPTTGKWMSTIKHLCGFILLGLAIWLLERVVSEFTITIVYFIFIIIFTIFALFNITTKNKVINFISKSIIILLSISSMLIILTKYNSDIFSIEKIWPVNNHYLKDKNTENIKHKNTNNNWNKVISITN